MAPASRRAFRDGMPVDDPLPVDGGRDLEAGLPWGSCWVQDLGRSPTSADAQRCKGLSTGLAEAACLKQQTLAVKLPPSAKPGEVVATQGPHGVVDVEVPVDHKPGGTVLLRLKAPPQMCVQVPRNGKPGDVLRVTRVDKVNVRIGVPKGLKEGDYFGVAAPALIVAVPESVLAGDTVVFRDPASRGAGQWLQAKCPKELLYARYFVAWLPAP